MDLLLIRHADAVGAGHGYFGKTETPLSPRGHEQALRLAPVLAAFAPDEIWSSPSRRAQSTLALALKGNSDITNAPLTLRKIGVGRSHPDKPSPQGGVSGSSRAVMPGGALAEPRTNRSFSLVADLREIDFGRWEGKTFDEIAAADPDKISDWAALKPDFTFPGGESLRDFEARIHRVADRIRSSASSRLVIVTHGGIIRYLLADLLRLSSDRVWIFALPPGSVTALHLQDGYAQITSLTKNEDLRLHASKVSATVSRQ